MAICFDRKIGRVDQISMHLGLDEALCIAGALKAFKGKVLIDNDGAVGEVVFRKRVSISDRLSPCLNGSRVRYSSFSSRDLG
ncbi:hypothetical protein OAG52_00680 [Verrucomicrobia bacterium]|nr:hypothetical protein [Verrucomicrobiota bacterium]